MRKILAERRRDGARASLEEVVIASEVSLTRMMQPSQRRVFNLTGTVLHMLSGVAIAGQVGLTAIGDSPAEADGIYSDVGSALLAATIA